MPTLTAPSGQAVHYEDYGRGPVVILVHGSPGNAKVWQKVGEALSSRFRVLAPSLPTSPRSDVSVPHVAGLIEAIAAQAEPPRVLAGHSHGGVVALRVALDGRVQPRALALFEPVAISILETVGDREAFDDAKVVFDDYIARVQGGRHQAVTTMVEYWFGAGAFERMPQPMREFLQDNAPHNVRDVAATFGERYTREALGALAMPVSLVVGALSPDVTFKIAGALASLAPRGTLTKLDNANHALVTTHAGAVAAHIAALAEANAHNR